MAGVMNASRRFAAMAVAGWVSVASGVACSTAGTTLEPASSDAGSTDAANQEDASALEASAEAGVDATKLPGAPSLVALAISGSTDGGGLAPLALSPSFSPERARLLRALPGRHERSRPSR